MGHRNFSTGVSHLKQVSGKEHRDLAHQLAPVIAGHPHATPAVKKTIRGFLDFSFKVQFPLHSTTSLDDLESDCQVYMKWRPVFLTNGAHSDGNPNLNHFNIPKPHYYLHARANIEDLGTADGFSTETSESLHIPMCKEAYASTNRKNPKAQMIKYLERREALALHTAYITEWTRLEDETNEGDLDCGAFEGGKHDDEQPTNSLAIYNHIQHAKRSHEIGVHIKDLVDCFSAIDIISPLVRFFKQCDWGCASRARVYYNIDSLPPFLATLNLWLSFKVISQPPNSMYAVQKSTIRCSIPDAGQQAISDSVLIEVDPIQPLLIKSTSIKTSPR